MLVSSPPPLAFLALLASQYAHFLGLQSAEPDPLLPGMDMVIAFRQSGASNLSEIRPAYVQRALTFTATAYSVIADTKLPNHPI